MKTINEVYAGKTFKEISEGLEAVGQIGELNKFSKSGLSVEDRDRIKQLRDDATKYGLSRKLQAAMEFNGAMTVRKGVRS